MDFAQTDVLLYGALASKEANQDPIDLAFLAAAAKAHMPLDTFTQKEFIPFEPKTKITAATIEKEVRFSLSKKVLLTKYAWHVISRSKNQKVCLAVLISFLPKD